MHLREAGFVALNLSVRSLALTVVTPMVLRCLHFSSFQTSA